MQLNMIISTSLLLSAIVSVSGAAAQGTGVYGDGEFKEPWLGVYEFTPADGLAQALREDTDHNSPMTIELAFTPGSKFDVLEFSDDNRWAYVRFRNEMERQAAEGWIERKDITKVEIGSSACATSGDKPSGVDEIYEVREITLLRNDRGRPCRNLPVLLAGTEVHKVRDIRLRDGREAVVVGYPTADNWCIGHIVRDRLIQSQ